MSTSDLLVDPRTRAELLRLEAVERRDQALLAQRSPGNSPQERVRIWERLHQVRLPRDPAHAILPQVAESTGLQLSEVLEVQRLRAQPASDLPASDQSARIQP